MTTLLINTHLFTFHTDLEPKSLTTSSTNAELAAAVTSLSDLGALRSSIIGLHSAHLEIIEQGAGKLSSAQEVQKDASQLCATLNAQFIESAREAAFQQQLHDICEQLDVDGAQNEGLERLLCGPDADSIAEGGGSLDIRDELEKAWMLDQLKLLESKGTLLDAVRMADIIQVFCSQPPLRQYAPTAKP